jgi:branched-chain amino acid transport system ATP-binding protein
MTALLEVEGVSKRFQGLQAVDAASFAVEEREIFAIIGPNGAGKTTLFNTIARTFQLVRPFPGLTVEANVVVGALVRRGSVEAARAHASEVLRRLDLFERRDQLASTLTLPDRKRLEVARAVATGPRLLLLDEVMAGLRPIEADRMIATLAELRDGGLTIILIEHVMRAVLALADRVLVLHHGAVIAQGPPQEVVRAPAVVHSYLGAQAL